MNEPDAADTAGPENDAPIYLAPYELWNFGEGKPYALPVIRGDILYITAVAEHPEPIGIPTKAISDNGTDGRLSWLPTLWMSEPPLYNLSFLPFLLSFPLKLELNPASLSELLRDGFKQLFENKKIDLSNWVRFIDNPRFRLSFPLSPEAMNLEIADLPNLPQWEPDEDVAQHPAKDNMTVVAVIDAGIPFAHRNFRTVRGDKTRVEFCWMQDAPVDDKDNRGTVAFGREFGRERINQLIQHHGDDEDFLYAISGAAADLNDSGSPINRHNSHGGHVMDLASGFTVGRDEEFKPDCDKDISDVIRLIAVQLPDPLSLDTSGFGRDMYILSAFHYIFNRADEIKEKYCVNHLRLVVNFSYGFTAGPHDAESVVEKAVDEMVRKRRSRKQPTAVVVPSGNSFVDRTHALIREEDFGSDQKVTVEWRIQPNDRTPSYLEFWFPDGFDPSKYSVSITDPTGYQCAPMCVEGDTFFEGTGDPRNVGKIHDRHSNLIGQLSVDQHRADSRTNKTRARWRILIILAPTEPEDQSLPGAEAGIWRIAISRTADACGLQSGVIRCWVQRDIEFNPFRTGARQSYFDDPGYRLFDDEGKLNEQDEDDTNGDPTSYVRRFGSLSGLATADTFITVAGYRTTARNDGDVICPVASVYSASGLLPSPIAMRTIATGEAISDLSDAATHNVEMPGEAVEAAINENEGDSSQADENEEDGGKREYQDADAASTVDGDNRNAGNSGQEQVGDRESNQNRWAVSNEQVDCSSMSDRSTILPGTIAAGTRSGATSILQGTSAAAPIVTRCLAKKFVTENYNKIKQNEASNYLGLIEGTFCEESLDTVRLGEKRIEPYGQPGIAPSE